MNRFFRVFLVFSFFGLAAGGGFYAGILCNQRISANANSKNNSVNEEPYTKNETYSETSTETAQVSNVISYDCEYEIISYDITTKEQSSRTESIPEYFIGKTKSQAEDILSEYDKTPVLTEREKGFVSSKLQYFSTDKMVVLKIYESEKEQDSFLLKNEKDYIVVYLADEETIYMHTGICVDSLPKDLQEEIQLGKRIQTIEELYYFLESYTS